VLGPASSAAALAPSGVRLVAAVPAASGAAIELLSVDGAQGSVRTTLPPQVLAVGWLSDDTALVAELDRIVTVDLFGHVKKLSPLPPNTTTAAFAPGGGQAFAGNSSQDG